MVHYNLSEIMDEKYDVPVLAFAGYSNSGKTTLVERIIEGLSNAGYRVAAVKHDVHGIKEEHEGTDSWRFLKAGASTVVLCAPEQILVLGDGANSKIAGDGNNNRCNDCNSEGSKESYRYRCSACNSDGHPVDNGANDSMRTSETADYALINNPGDVTIHEIIMHLSNANHRYDIILIEGWKHEPLPKIQVERFENVDQVAADIAEGLEHYIQNTSNLY